MTIEKEIRKAYFEAIGNERKLKKLLDTLKSQDDYSATLWAYRAACESMMAQFSWNPYTKLAQVNKSFDFFEKAIDEDAQNLEVRFLRFSVQHNVPDFLRKGREFEEDKSILLLNFKKADLEPDFKGFIKEYLKDSGRFKQEELVGL